MNLDHDATSPSVPAPSPPAGGRTTPHTVPDEPSAGPPARRPTSPGPSTDRAGLLGRLSRAVTFVSDPRAPYQAALLRIGIGLVVTAFLVREWPRRRVLYGDHSPWSLEMARPIIAEDHAFTILTWWSGHWWFECVYHGTIAAALLMMLGWRTRATSVLCMVGVLSLQFRGTYMGDGGDNVLRIMVIYLVFTRCAQVWSLDARRRRRTGAAGRTDRAGFVMWQGLGVLLGVLFGFETSGWPAFLWALWGVQGLWYAADRWLARHETRALLERLGSLVHNSAMFVIAAQVCLIYATAGWYKIQGSRWQDGSALHYAMHLEYFAPYPELAAVLTSGMLPVFCLSYATVIVQVAFPFTLTHRKIKNVLLAVMIAEHAAIAVTLGLPFLSAAMIVCDALFLPTAFLLWATGRLDGLRHLGRRAAALRRSTLPHQPGAPSRPPAEVATRRQRTTAG